MIERDFTLSIYKKLLISAIDANYKLIPYKDFVSNVDSSKRVIVLKHDVDKNPGNALQMARLESSLGVKASYYFRITNNSYSKLIISEIANLGHEIGFHYEELSTTKGDYKKAINLFRVNLEKVRALYPVVTICMHGSPMSPWDNKSVWSKYNYRDFGIISDPFFDIDFNKILYLTDTGRSWDNKSFSVRDKVISGFDFRFKSTNKIIESIINKKLPDKVIISTHPQRWFNSFLPWVWELFLQNLKNLVKKHFVQRSNLNVDKKE